MSKKSRYYDYENYYLDTGYYTYPSLRYLTILILIILQFSKREINKSQLIDNSILFIIALYFLSCCSGR